MNIADRILQNQDRDGMLRRSLERIIQLYTDKSHFVYELLQNAEDAGATSIKFIQYEDRLEVMHDGNPFTTENLQGLCDIGQSDKVNNLNQIGEFGVGFKSVFGICDTVRLYSAPDKKLITDSCQPFAVEIQDFTKPVDIPPVPVPGGYTTLFVFPYSVGFQFSGFKTIATLNEAISKRLKNLGVTTLLFMRHLELIEYEIKIPGKNATGEYLLNQEVINEHCVRVSAVESENKKEDNSLSFIKFTMPIDSTASIRTIDIAFAISRDKNGKTSFVKAKNPYVSVYFPTETKSELDFVVQGPFRTTPNRGSVPADEEENIALAHKVAKLLRRSVLELRDMNLLDLSFIKILPLDADSFDVYDLFYPLYEETLSVLETESILPVKGSTSYTKASSALIARGKEIAELLPTDLITALINDKKRHYWLPLSLTETGPFKDVLSYLTNELGIEVIRPEDLRSYFNDNTQFLQQRDNEWFVKLYRLYETVPNIFSEKNYRNILDAMIIRTESGNILAPFRKADMTYHPNVFLPAKSGKLAGIEYVHPYLYEQCKSFFEKVLHLTIPDEYQFFVKDLEKKYGKSVYSGAFEGHLQDIKKIIFYMKSQEYGSDIRSIARKSFLLSCRKGSQQVWVHPFESKILFPMTESGLMLEQYYKCISDDVCFIDYDAYQSAGVFYDALRQLGVTDSILTGETRTWGEYYTGKPGRQPEWRTSGAFRWKLSIDRVEDVLIYISQHPKSKDSIIKSQTIFKILQAMESVLVGNVYIGGSTPNKYDEPAEIVHILSQESHSWQLSGWNGKWVYTESQELVSHKTISKHDLNKAIYGRVSLDSELYDILGFKKGRIDLHEAIVKDYDALPEDRKQSYFEIELERRFHITPEQLKMEIGGFVPAQEGGADDEDEYVFPTGAVKNWDALRKHAAQILSYASPTVYATVVRSIRVSRPQDDIRAYLMNMYRVNSTYKYACQLCHNPVSNIEACELELKPDVELDPMNICLCPNCAQKFRSFRNNSHQSSRLIEEILDVSESEIDSDSHVSVAVGDYDFWFTQTHIAEIAELLKLKKQAKEEKKSPSPITIVPAKKNTSPESQPDTAKDAPSSNSTDSVEKNDDDDYGSDMSAYKELIGKRIFHKGKKAYARVVDLTTNSEKPYIVLNFETGNTAGMNKDFDLIMCLNNQWIEVVD